MWLLTILLNFSDDVLNCPIYTHANLQSGISYTFCFMVLLQDYYKVYFSGESNNLP